MSEQPPGAAARDATSLRDLARTPELRALLIEHAGRGFRVQAILRGVLAIFVLLTVVLVPPANERLAALLVALAYCVWAVTVYLAVRVSAERVWNQWRSALQKYRAATDEHR